MPPATSPQRNRAREPFRDVADTADYRRIGDHQPPAAREAADPRSAMTHVGDERMNVAVLGLGYVGCVSAACLARQGHRVFGIDVNPTKVDLINGGRSPIVEAEVDELIAEAVAAGAPHGFDGGHGRRRPVGGIIAVRRHAEQRKREPRPTVRAQRLPGCRARAPRSRCPSRRRRAEHDAARQRRDRRDPGDRGGVRQIGGSGLRGLCKPRVPARRLGPSRISTIRRSPSSAPGTRRARTCSNRSTRPSTPW